MGLRGGLLVEAASAIWQAQFTFPLVYRSTRTECCNHITSRRWQLQHCSMTILPFCPDTVYKSNPTYPGQVLKDPDNCNWGCMYKRKTDVFVRDNWWSVFFFSWMPFPARRWLPSWSLSEGNCQMLSHSSVSTNLQHKAAAPATGLHERESCDCEVWGKHNQWYPFWWH